MSLRLEMLQVARLAPTALGPEASGLIARFVLASHDEASGGFRDRDGKPDLYYTSFAVDGLTALQVPPPDSLGRFLGAADPGALDFVHAACLARLLSAVEMRAPQLVDRALQRIEEFRTADGGYSQSPGAETGSAYGCLLGFGAYADHRREPPAPDGIAECLERLRADDGGWANELDLPIGGVPPTAAAVTLLRNLRRPVPPDAGEFLMTCHDAKAGGFRVFREAPIPDLLSTAVALHALDGLQRPIEPIRESCLDFVDSLWTAEGGFHGNWTDDTLDVEYTYYGLLALGHLAL